MFLMGLGFVEPILKTCLFIISTVNQPHSYVVKRNILSDAWVVKANVVPLSFVLYIVICDGNCDEGKDEGLIKFDVIPLS